MRRGDGAQRTGQPIDEAERLQRLARELNDDIGSRRQATSRSPTRQPSRSPTRQASRPTSLTPSFRGVQELPPDVLGPFPQDHLQSPQAYALSTAFLVEDEYTASPRLGSPGARRCDAVAQELREERLRRRNTREQRRGRQSNEAEVAAATEAALAAEAAAERSNWECQMALRHVEAVEARQMATSPGKASPLRGGHKSTYLAGRQRNAGASRGRDLTEDTNGRDRLLEELIAAEDAQKRMSSELEVARKELDDRRAMDRGMQREIEELRSNHDPDAAALLYLRRELEAANLEADISKREAQSELVQAQGEVADMQRELEVLHGSAPQDAVQLAITSRNLERAQRQLAERPGTEADRKALQAGRDADAKALMKVHRENADAMQELQRRRARDRSIADELEEMEAALGIVCTKLHKAERTARKDTAFVLTGSSAPLVNMAVLPLSFLMWISAVLVSKLSNSGKTVRAARLEAAQKSTKGPSLGIPERMNHGLHVRWFEMWHRLRCLRRAVRRAINVFTLLLLLHDAELLRAYFALWRAGFLRLRKQVEALGKPHGAVDEDAPTSRCFRVWLVEVERRRRLRARGMAFANGQQQKQSAWYTHRALTSWSRLASVNRAESKLARVSVSYNSRHAITEQLLGISGRQASRQGQTWLLSSVWRGWASQCRTAIPRSKAAVSDTLKAACQLWYYGEVDGGLAESLIAELLPLWSRLAMRQRAQAAAADRESEFYEAQEALYNTRRMGQDQMDDASSQQAAFMAREVAMWCAWAAWQVWSITVESKRVGSRVVLETSKQDGLSKFLYVSRAAEQVWSLFLLTWNAWARLASTSRADATHRDVVDLVRDSSAERMMVMDSLSENMWTIEANFRCVVTTFSMWSYQMWHKKTKAALYDHAGYADRELIVEKAKYAYGVLSMLHEQELSAWRVQSTWMAWAYDVERNRLHRVAEEEVGQERQESKNKRTRGMAKVLQNFGNQYSSMEMGLVWHAWKELVYKEQNGDLFGSGPALVSKALLIYYRAQAHSVAAQAWPLVVFRSWKYLISGDRTVKDHVATKVRTQVNRFADVWSWHMEPKTHRLFIKRVLSAWFGLHLFGIQLRTLGFTATRLLERSQLQEAETIKQFMFALWCCQSGTSPLARLQPPPMRPPPLASSEQSALGRLNTLATVPDLVDVAAHASPGRAATTDLPGVQPHRQNPNRLFDCLESLMSVRSRGWRLVIDLRSMAEGSLLRVGELHEAMLVLLEQAARKALRPNEDVGFDAGSARMADVLRLSAEAEKHDMQLQERMRERQPLSAALLECTSAAVRMVLESRGVTTEDAQALKLLAAELCELRSDEKKLVDACGALLSRIEAVGVDLRSLADARQELPGTPGTSSGAASEGRALDGAGDSAKRLLQGAVAGVTALRNDAQGLLQYLDASELLRSVAAWGPDGAVTDSIASHAPESRLSPLQQDLTSSSWPSSVLPIEEAPSPIPRLRSLPESSPSRLGWIEDEVLSAIGPAGPPLETIGNTSGLSALVGPETPRESRESRRIDHRKLGEFQLKWRRPRLQNVWRSWLLFVQLIRRLRGAALDSELQGALDQLGGRGSTYSGPGPQRGPRGPALAGPATRGTVGAVERLLLG